MRRPSGRALELKKHMVVSAASGKAGREGGAVAEGLAAHFAAHFDNALPSQ